MRGKAPTPEIAKLEQMFTYDDDRGWLIWKSPTAKRVKVGDRAGTPSGERRLVGVGGRIYLEHRIIFALVHGKWPDAWIDHIDGNPSNNKVSNLRLATPAQNAANCKMRVNNKSGIKGVFWAKDREKWRAQLRLRGKSIHLGQFASKQEAFIAYEEASNRLFGDFSRPINNTANAIKENK